jgi:biopolymer transport protein ExbD
MPFDTNAKKRRKPSLTPMIDVVFLLLVFFMLASQFGLDQIIRLPLAGASSAAEYKGPPRLVAVTGEGVSLNGVSMSLERVAQELEMLTDAPADTIVIRGRDEASTQDILDVLSHLKSAGFETIVLVD